MLVGSAAKLRMFDELTEVVLDDLSLTAVAEGIETHEELGHARAIGVGLGQGTLLGPPTSGAAVIAWVVDHGLRLPHLIP